VLEEANVWRKVTLGSNGDLRDIIMRAALTCIGNAQ